MGNTVYVLDLSEDNTDNFGGHYVWLMILLDSIGVAAGLVMLYTLKTKAFYRSFGQRIVLLNVCVLFTMSFARVMIMVTNHLFPTLFKDDPPNYSTDPDRGQYFEGIEYVDYTCFVGKFFEYATISAKAPLNAMYLLWYKYYVMDPIITNEQPDQQMFEKWIFLMKCLFMLYFGLRVMFIDEWVVSLVFCDGESSKGGILITQYIALLLNYVISSIIVLVLLYEMHYRKPLQQISFTEFVEDDEEHAINQSMESDAWQEDAKEDKAGSRRGAVFLGDQDRLIDGVVSEPDEAASQSDSEHILRARSNLQAQQTVYKKLFTWLSFGFLLTNFPQLLTRIPTAFSPAVLQLLFHLSSIQNVWDMVVLHYFVPGFLGKTISK